MMAVFVKNPQIVTEHHLFISSDTNIAIQRTIQMWKYFMMSALGRLGEGVCENFISQIIVCDMNFQQYLCKCIR